MPTVHWLNHTMLRGLLEGLGKLALIAPEAISITKGRVRGRECKPKTKSSIRTIPINGRVQNALDSAKVLQKTVAPVEDYVFTDKKGVRSRSIWTAFGHEHSIKRTYGTGPHISCGIRSSRNA
jgi:hypothetical protein